MSDKILYCGVSRGLEGHSVLYFGAARRIPSHEFHEDFVAASEKYDAGLPGSLLDDFKDYERIQNIPIERFDTYDKETGDMLVLWRVPYRPKARPSQDDATPLKGAGTEYPAIPEVLSVGNEEPLGVLMPSSAREDNTASARATPR